jgi:hypothetical protein
MRPENGAATARARALWDELAGVYDALEAAVASGDFAEAAHLTERFAELEAVLGPVWGEVQAARAAAGSHAPAALAAEWAALDAAIVRLQERCQALAGTAETARASTARTLAAARVGRAQTQDYARGAALAPRFTSRRV